MYIISMTQLIIALTGTLYHFKILDIVIELFNNGGDESLDVPSTLSLPDIPVIPKDCDDQTRRSISKQRKFAKKIHKENFSLRMDMLYKLSMSNHYRDDLFWLPHNMDFRSRVYPIPPHITHLSSDVGRSLIQFGIGYPLGKRGLEWLMIHIATLHGATSKASLKERLKFTNEMLPEIFDSSDKPLDGNGWWKTSDEPWQTLACCMELTEALRSGDPESFLSHMPVHQDGSCNGLQHYAAMGRDTYGAQQVNLTPLDVPANLYAEVAYLVDKRRERDAANGHKLAQLLEGHVHRKVVKQTVMTVVYGVTWVGGRKQIEKQLKDNISNDVLFEASGYLVGAVFDSLREMFTNARLIQDWLTTSARMIALAGHPVQWITPLGMPVVQPYHRPISKQIRMRRLQTVLRTNTADFSRPPNSAKQTTAMPPNFVHSLDSTHMMLTALHCQRTGVPFVAVHDSYWTHGSFVDQMNKICREQFVALHSQPILEELADYFELKYGGLVYVMGYGVMVID
jgi:DNA-directed RNA polymerase